MRLDGAQAPGPLQNRPQNRALGGPWEGPPGPLPGKCVLKNPAVRRGNWPKMGPIWSPWGPTFGPIWPKIGDAFWGPPGPGSPVLLRDLALNRGQKWVLF